MKLSRVLATLIICTILIVVLLSGFKIHQQPFKSYKPVTDFSWLTEFYILTRCLNIEHWENDPNRKFDKSGVLMDKGKYHPVNIFQYSLICFDYYKRTNDTTYKTKFLNQVKYVMDTSHYKTFADGTIGFPYDITFRDLKPTWYSALAQSEGMMMMIRYYAITKDKAAIPLIENMLHFMLKDQKDGGTFLQLNDTAIWLQEYPNSKSKPEVLNGFVTTIMALNEYCKMFPDDKSTKKILDQCIRTHKDRVNMYDKGNGILYDQGEKQQVGAWYMKFQVIQMEHMYDLFKDPFYKQLQYLYAYYAYNKPITNMIGCRLNDTNYCAPAERTGNYIRTSGLRVNILKPGDLASAKGSFGLPTPDNIKLIFDSKPGTCYTFKNNDTLLQPPYISGQFRRKFLSDKILLSVNPDFPNLDDFSFFYSDKPNSSWKELKHTVEKKSGREYALSFNETEFSAFKVELHDSTCKRNYGFCEINFQNIDSNKFTSLSYALIDSISIPAMNCLLSFQSKDVQDYVIYYQLGLSKVDLNKTTTWDYKRVITDITKPIKTGDYKVMKLLIIYRNKTKGAYLKDLKLLKA